MMTTVVIHDESMSGESLRQQSVEIPGETITVKELIRSRVYQDAKESNARAVSKRDVPLTFQPAEAELTLNGPRSNQPTLVDWKVQFEKAIEAFCSKSILILVDDRQVNALNEQIQITSSTKISFLRLTMLMGG
jgi:hypothetical protein